MFNDIIGYIDKLCPSNTFNITGPREILAEGSFGKVFKVTES